MSAQTPSESGEQAEHAQLFKRVSDHLAVAAGKLASLSGPVKLDALDVGGLFIATGLNLFLHSLPDADVARYLRSLADGVEAGQSRAN